MTAMTRRTLLGRGAGLISLSAISASAAPKSNERIGVGVIGCRNRGWQVASNLHKSGHFDIVAICDCDGAMLQRAAKKLDEQMERGPEHVKDFRTLLDDKRIDVIVVATPDHWHALMTVMALEAGKHVYVEKPASFNIADGKAMVAAQKKHPRQIVQVGSQQRSMKHYTEAKAFIDEGGLGKIGFARAWMSAGRVVVKRIPNTDPPKSLDYDMWVGPAAHTPYNEEKLHYNWHFTREYGTNDAGNWGAHHLDIVRWFADLGLPHAAAGSGGTFIVDDAKEWFDTQTAMFTYPHTTVVWEMRHWSTGASGTSTGAELRGEKGTMIIHRGGWTFQPREGDAQRHSGSPLEPLHVENFAACIRGQAKPNAPIDEGHKTAVLCHLANITTLYNRSVRFDPKAETILDDPEAKKLEAREYRDKWSWTA